jgi:serine/threonine-protein kinase HipA
MIRVWTDGRRAGVLDRLSDGPGSTFAYDPTAPTSRAVSVTMPVRVQSWDVKYGLPPIFEMNLPEGALRERLIKKFAKAAGSFDDFDLLSVVGRSQIGRIRYSGLDEDISENVPFQSIDEILKARRDGGLFEFLLDRFASHSGLSGVQPKFMIRATGKASDNNARISPTVQSATHIVKLWDPEEYPELAANENFCLLVAKRLGLEVPSFRLSDDGGALVVDRFDYRNGSYLGFEDFCVLNALPTRDKYDGGYERRLFRRFQDYVPLVDSPEAHKRLFQLFVLNCAVRNGDAHLKNFGIVYEDVNSQAALAPVYDIITTAAYIPQDPMALTLEGSTRWPDRKKLIRLGQARAEIPKREIEMLMEQTADAMSDVAKELRKYFNGIEFAGVGERMIEAWDTGIKDSLGVLRGLSAAPKPEKREKKVRLARSDSLILEDLRESGGTLLGTQKALADRLGIPASTVGGAIKRLADRKLIEVGPRKLVLLQREV